MEKGVLPALRRLNACEEAMRWVRTQKSKAIAWRCCANGDWMFWLLEKTRPAKPSKAYHRKMVGLASAIGKLVLPFSGRQKTKLKTKVYAVLDRFAGGEDVSKEELDAALAAARSAAWAAWNAAYAARSAADAASDAADAAISAANAARSAAYAAWYAAWAASYAALAAKSATYAARYAARAAGKDPDEAESAIRRQIPDLIRQYFPTPPRIG